MSKQQQMQEKKKDHLSHWFSGAQQPEAEPEQVRPSTDTHEKHSTQETDDKHSTQGKPLTEEEAIAILQMSQRILQSVPEEAAIALTGKRGRPKKAEEEKLRGYRYNLNLDRDLQPYLKETAWRKRTSITQYINDLIRADMEAYFKECEAQGIDPKAGWETDEV